LLPAALVIAAAGGLWSMRGDVSSTPAAYTGIEPALNAASSPGSPLTTDLFRTIARQQNPVVVAIMTKARVEVSPGEGDPFRWFFGGPQQPESQVQRGLGSGFLISRDGDILTNNHVVAGADAIEVSLFGDETKTYKATLGGRDPLSDTALIRYDAQALGLGKAEGAIVTSVERGSPADRAGLRAGDVVVTFNGSPIASADDLVPRVSSMSPGTQATLTVIRDGREVTLHVAVEELTTEEGAATRPSDISRDFGLQLGDVTPSIARQLGLPSGLDGAVVYDVADDSPAGRAGMRQGDIVRSVNRHAVHRAAQAVQELRRIGTGQPAFLIVWRDGNETLVQMRKE
jgi:serine protease Do